MDTVRDIVARHFRIYEERTEPMMGDTTAQMFFLMFPPEEFDARFEAVRQEMRELDPNLLLFMRQEGGEDILVVAPRPPVQENKSKVNLFLLILTLGTTITAGAMYWQGYAHGGETFSWSSFVHPENLLMGALFFALPLMLILGIHESAHYIAAKRHGLRSSLPFFLPIPPMIMPFGTLGAFISLKDPLPDRKALFDVGASGPLAGFIVAIPIILLGAMLTNSSAIAIPEHDQPDILTDGLVESLGPGEMRITWDQPVDIVFFTLTNTANETWSYQLTGTSSGDSQLKDVSNHKLQRGESVGRTMLVADNATSARVVITWDSGLIRFGDPLLVKGLEAVGLSSGNYLTHPLYFAGWVGLLVTGINLLPAGQLDGGHISRAVFGENSRYVSYAAVGLLMYFAVRFQSWMLMALFILLMGLNHPPPLNDRTPLDKKRLVVAGVVLVVFALTFITRPVIF